MVNSFLPALVDVFTHPRYCFSGYQWIRALKEEKEIDEDFIEQEGNVYMERIQEAKKLKEQQEL